MVEPDVTGQAIGDVIALAVGVAVSPLAVVALVVMLVSPGDARGAWAFAGGWVGSLAVVVTIVILLADGADASENGSPATWVSVVKTAIALFLVVIALRQWRTRDSDDDQHDGSPGWLRKLDDASPGKAALLATLFNTVKPKNLLLTIGAGVAIAQVGASAAGQAIAAAVFVALGSASVAVPLAIHRVMGDRGRDRLIAMRDWMIAENATVIAVLCVLVAAKLLGDAITSLS